MRAVQAATDGGTAQADASVYAVDRAATTTVLLRIGTISSSDPNTTGEIRLGVLHNVRTLEPCYDLALGRHPLLAGHMLLGFALGPDARPADIEITDNTVPDPSVGECVVSAARRWSAIPSNSQGTVRVQVPLVMRVPGEAPRLAAAPVPGSPIAWQLVADPSSTITMSQRSDFRLWRVARNTGRHAANADEVASEFTVNGMRSTVLEIGFGNGGRENIWFALPPGRSVRDSRAVGEELFPAPGTYDIAMLHDAHELARVRVVVGP